MTQNQLNEPRMPKTISSSVAAATSMTFGIMSPIVLCSCLPAIVTSLFAIVFGHIALVKIKNSNGALTGRNRAITGLAIGYPFLIISLVLSPLFFSRIDNLRAAFNDTRNAGGNTAGSWGDAMVDAERKIVFSRKTVANGNDSDSIAMARELSDSLREAREFLIVSSDGKDHEGEFLVFCQNDEDSVCFLVFVPEYRMYEGEAKDALATVAWTAAASVVRDAGREDDCEVGLGLKGNLLYGSVMIGPAGQDSPNQKSSNRDSLKRFFQ